MSYNINHSEYIGEDRLTIMTHDASVLRDRYEDDLPECSFLEDVPETELNEQHVIENPWWYGQGSGHAYDECLKDILSHTKGHAKILFVWEGGDSQTALEVKDGSVAERKVKVELQ